MDKKGLSVKKLKSLLKLWQKRLLLNDWNLSIKVVEFKRKDYRQSGDIKVFPRKMKAVVLLTNNPFRDEESVLVHELVHLVLWDYDIFCEKLDWVIQRQNSKVNIENIWTNSNLPLTI